MQCFQQILQLQAFPLNCATMYKIGYEIQNTGFQDKPINLCFQLFNYRFISSVFAK